jgi:hypothetical protein
VSILDLPSGVHVVTRGDRLRANDEAAGPTALLGRVTGIRRGPFRFDPTTPVSGGWRAASALIEGALACRRLLSSVWRRAKTLETRRAIQAS